MREITITKASGKKARFDPSKVKSTCMRAGADKETARRIVNQIRPKLYAGITTKEIYRLVLKSLAENAGIAVRQRYRLKESIMRMGPAGFSFEVFVGKVLENYGYKINSVGASIQGRCILHEVDLALESTHDRKKWMVECKYHNTAGKYTGLKESLYTHARFLDLSDVFDHEMLACNTRVSEDVITYARCVRQEVLSWKYPQEKGLERLIEDKKLYPVTILGLNRDELEAFLEHKLLIAKDLLDIDASYFAKKTGIAPKRLLALQKLTNHIFG